MPPSPCLRRIGIDTGGSNVQFALNPADGRMVVIEMNPRVSRSSALASKATGFPIAKIAAKLAVGYTLDELANDITRHHAGQFRAHHRLRRGENPPLHLREIPRHAGDADHVDEIGGRGDGDRPEFAEALQKGLRSVETGLGGLDGSRRRARRGGCIPRRAVAAQPDRLLMAAQALRAGLSVEDIHELGKFDPWFLRELERIVHAERGGRSAGLPQEAGALRRLKALGFSDVRLGELAGPRETAVRGAARQGWGCTGLQAHRHLRRRIRLRTPYMSSTYKGGYGVPVCESDPPTGRRSSSSAAARTVSDRA